MTFKKTILQVIPSLDAGGAERTTLEMAQAIVQCGGKAIVCTYGGRLCRDVEELGGHVVKLPVHSKNPLTIALNVRRLKTLIRTEQIDLVHSRSRAPAWSVLFAARKLLVPIVTTYHGAYRNQSSLKRYLNSSMIRADRVIANSEYTANAILKAYCKNHHQLARRLRLIPRGADLSNFDPVLVSKSRIAQLENDWGISRKSGEFLFLMPARMTSWKGHLQVIRALAQIKAQNPSEKSDEGKRATGNVAGLKVAFVGDGGAAVSYMAELQNEIDERGVGTMISFVGHCADMPAAYCMADAVLSPSLRPEAFGRIAVEAGAMKKPVIVADHGGARETVRSGETGVRVPPGNVEELALAMVSIANMGIEERNLMGHVARQFVQRHYSITAMTDATLGVYRELLDQKLEMDA